MSNETNNVVKGGIGFFGLLQIAFIVLKLCKVISWSWWFVLIPTLAYVGIVVIVLLVYVIAILNAKRITKKRG